jgi:hypothetical protein
MIEVLGWGVVCAIGFIIAVGVLRFGQRMIRAGKMVRAMKSTFTDVQRTDSIRNFGRVNWYFGWVRVFFGETFSSGYTTLRINNVTIDWNGNVVGS